MLQIRARLAGLGCCLRCIDRLVGLRVSAAASAGTPTAQVENSMDQPENPASIHTKCSACLGLLQMDHTSLAKDAFKVFVEKAFQLGNLNTFAIATTLPPQLAVRQRAFVLLLAHEFTHPLADPIEVKEVLKSLIKTSFASASGLQFSVDSPLSYSTKFIHQESVRDWNFMTELSKSKFTVSVKRDKAGKLVHHGASNEKIAHAAALLDFEDFSPMIPPPTVQTDPVVSEIDFVHSQIYVAGRYLKLERHISNSPWIIKGKRLTEHSMEELIGKKIDAFFKTRNHKFSSAGREDADVLMLGDGRPFYFELISPHKVFATQEQLTNLQREIVDDSNGKIDLFDLQLVSKDSLAALKESASSKSKSYRCKVLVQPSIDVSLLHSLNNMTNLAVDQQNPTRVPRRADLLRSKVVQSMLITAEDVSEGVASVLIIDLTTSAGTYVKEFMHGDGGRTVPSVKSLLKLEDGEVTVLSLDVLKIHLDWPPRIDSCA